MKKRKIFNIINLSLIFVFILTSGFGCKGTSKEVEEKLQPVTLKYWRLWDDEDAFEEIIQEYRALHPNIRIEYHKFRYEEYEQELLDALAEDRGPDIISIHNSWLKKYQAKLAPMPAEITMAYQKVKGTIKKETVVELETKSTMSLRQLKDQYADVVYKNAVLDGKIYGLPLSLETLIMYYNKDILNRSGVAQAPETWKNFQEAVIRTTRKNSQGGIQTAGAAMGTGENIDRSFDILSMIMMQNGTEMIDSRGRANFFNQDRDKRNRGIESFQFYLEFSDPVRPVYTWNEDMNNSIDSFIEGKVGFMFGYNYHLPIIKARSPRLNLGMAPSPQLNPGQPVSYASYWMEGVSQKSAHQDEAWDFILFATQKEQAKKYLDKTNKPTALKSLINEQLENEDLHAAVVQILTADNWYQGIDPIAAENAFLDMISQAVNSTSEKELNEIIKTATQKVNQTLQ